MEGWRGGGVEGWRGGGMVWSWLDGGLEGRWVLGMVLALPPAHAPHDSVWPISSAHLVFFWRLVYRMIMRIFFSFFSDGPRSKGSSLYGFFQACSGVPEKSTHLRQSGKHPKNVQSVPAQNMRSSRNLLLKSPTPTLLWRAFGGGGRGGVALACQPSQ